jgi:hypothetical protein
VDNKLFNDWMKARAQAHYFDLAWTITEDEYIAIWRINNRYLKKGRANDEFCLVRQDYNLGWHMNNVHVITRSEHYKICSKDKTGKFAIRKTAQEAKQNV